MKKTLADLMHDFYSDPSISINNLISWEWDDAQLTVISSTVDNWLYYLDAVLVGTIEITYSDANHTTITRQRVI